MDGRPDKKGWQTDRKAGGKGRAYGQEWKGRQVRRLGRQRGREGQRTGRRKGSRGPKDGKGRAIGQEHGRNGKVRRPERRKGREGQTDRKLKAE